MNKVETAVIAYFNIAASQFLTPEQKALASEKLYNRINNDGDLVVKAQTHRTQLENKEEALRKVHELVVQAVRRKKLRIATRPSKAARQARVETKKRQGEIKQGRKKFRPNDRF